ncbi:hypothetical protein ACT2VT_000867 [Pantoea agglomerans]
MQITKRKVWLLVFLFCVAVWGLIFSVVTYAGDKIKVEAQAQPGERTPSINVQKIKKLDLSDQQKKFIESLIELPEDKKK